MPRKSSQTESDSVLDQELPAGDPNGDVSSDPFSQTDNEFTASAADVPTTPEDTPENTDESQTDSDSTSEEHTEETEESPDPLDSQTEADRELDTAQAPGSSAHDDDNTSAPQIDSELNQDPAIEPLDQALDTADSQTGSETEGVQEPGDAEPDVNDPDPQTDTEPTIKRVTAARGRRRRADEDESPSQSDGEPAKTNQTTPRQSRPPRGRRQRSEPIVSIDEVRTVQTDADKLNNDILDLVESLKTKKILTGTIQGIERSEDNPNLSFAVVYHGEIKVIIPADETVTPPEDFRDRLPGDVMHYLVTKRLGAEIDYIVKGIDQNSGIAAASRLDAMAAKRRIYYFGLDREGNNLLYEGICAEARIVSVIRAGVFVDLFGMEIYIPLRELSYQRWMDASAHLQAGQRVLVKILSLDRSDRSSIKISASVKQAGENPYEKALRRYSVGSRYVGTVSMVDSNGVFVALDGGIDCLCSFPKRGRPPRGARVTVRILGLNNESNRIWGAITHMTTR